jgi:DNA primase
MPYNDPILQEIKDRLNIADVIGGYIQLKKAGVNFKAACPFHHEKTPSLIVNPQKQIWHCFGCGEGGDVFGFVKKIENLEFRDTLKLLAEKAGVKLPEYRPADPKIQNEQEQLLRINDFAARFYHEILTKDRRGKEALEYLTRRGLTQKTIEQWQIGFAPEDFHALEAALVKKGASLEDLVKAGVSAKNERGQIYDRFRGRITFPVFNYVGDIVGFSARILKDTPDIAKYVNSPETLIYQKSKILFGLNFAKNEIRKKDEAVVVEGQMDCIAPHQAGFTNVVATSGTALTSDQLQIISRLTKNLKFCFDADSAGQEAARRAGELALKQGFRLKLIALKTAKDPDELIKKSPGLWEKAVSEAVWFLDFFMDKAKQESPADPVEQLHYLSRQVIPLVGFIQDPLEQEHYIKKLNENFGISERTVKEQIKQPKIITPKQQGTGSDKVIGFALEKEILGAALVFPEFLAQVLNEPTLDNFEDPEIKAVLQGENGKIDKSSTLAKEAAFVVESQLDDLDGNEPALKRQLAKVFALFKINALKRRQIRLQLDIAAAERAGNKSKVTELNQLFAKITTERLGFEKQLN